MHHNPVQVDSWDSQRIDHHTWTNGIAHKLRGENGGRLLKRKGCFPKPHKKSVPGSVWVCIWINFLTNLARLHQGGSAFFWSPTFEGPKNRGLPHRLSSSLWDGKFFKKCAEEKENTQPSNDFKKCKKSEFIPKLQHVFKLQETSLYCPLSFRQVILPGMYTAFKSECFLLV